jgi:protein tyrosine/serine phosphatase
MRSQSTRLFVLLAGLLWLGCAATPASEAVRPAWRPVFEATETEATVLFDPAVFTPGHTVESVGLVGTFNSWNTNELWHLQKRADGTWGGRFPRSRLGVPGNSGVTEFQFIVDGSERITGNGAPAGQRFANNFVILWPGFTEALVAERDAENQKLRHAYDSDADLTNFRELAGGRLSPGRLFRSYHPFVASRELSTEQARLATIQRLMQEKQVTAVINLSDTADMGHTPRTPDHYRELVLQGKVLFAPTRYSTVYFASNGEEFTGELRLVLEFIASTPGPYLVHCRLGTDRTGVVAALLEGLAGVPWPVILEDFQKSNSLGIMEYRAPELLTYSITQFLGRNPADVPDLAAALRARLLEKQIEPTIIDQALDNLTR